MARSRKKRATARSEADDDAGVLVDFPTSSGSFEVLFVKTFCGACGGEMSPGMNVFVCSCRSPLHENCAGKIGICPNCNSKIRLG